MHVAWSNYDMVMSSRRDAKNAKKASVHGYVRLDTFVAATSSMQSGDGLGSIATAKYSTGRMLGVRAEKV